MKRVELRENEMRMGSLWSFDCDIGEVCLGIFAWDRMIMLGKRSYDMGDGFMMTRLV